MVEETQLCGPKAGAPFCIIDVIPFYLALNIHIIFSYRLNENLVPIEYEETNLVYKLLIEHSGPRGPSEIYTPRPNE